MEITRVGLCESGTRLALCPDGLRLGLCGDEVDPPIGGLCGSERICWECVADEQPPEQDIEIVPGHHFTWTMRQETIDCSYRGSQQLPFLGPPRYECENNPPEYEDRGAIGLAIQWGRPPTEEEIISEHGGSSYAQQVFLDPQQIRPNVWGRVYSFRDNPPPSLGVSPAATAGVPAAYVVGDDGLYRLGVAFTLPAFDSATCGRTEFPINPSDGPGDGDTQRSLFRRQRCNGLSGGFEIGEELTILSLTPPTSTQFPDHNWELAGLGVGDQLREFYQRVFATVQRVGGEVVIPGNWLGPPDVDLCPSGLQETQIRGTNPNASAIEAHNAADQVRRGGCANCPD